MSILSSLTRYQKEAVALLQIGTFLEYFDLMLYVHMATILNEIFFPKADAKTASLLTAFAFCSTYLLRPFGALIFGYIGDHIGRKTTVIITTMIMATACIIMATLPTYNQIGITAAWLVTFCRIAQGLSSMGEIIGAEIYVTEITKPPVQYPAVGFITSAARFGTVAALAVAWFVTSYGYDWRNAFWVGAAIAVVGSVARTRLRETPDFVDLKRRINFLKEENLAHTSKSELLKIQRSLQQKKVGWKTLVAYFGMSAGCPICLYFTYMYCGDLLKTMGFTAEQVIHQNFYISILEFLGMVLFSVLSYRIYPLKILKIKTLFLFVLMLPFPFLITYSLTPTTVFTIQAITGFLALNATIGDPIVFMYFPIFKRFTYISLIYASSRALISLLTSFGLVYLTRFLGPWGLYIVMIPTTLAFLFGTLHFNRLEMLKKKMEEQNKNSLTEKAPFTVQVV